LQIKNKNVIKSQLKCFTLQNKTLLFFNKKIKMRNIIIGEGLDDLKFGMQREEVVKILGEPEDVDIFDYEETEEKSEAWHYDTIEVSAAFDEAEDWQLVSLAISSPECQINDKKLIGLAYNEALKVIETLELGELEFEDVTDEEDNNKKYKQIFAQDANISFWFDENLLSEIQWGPIWDIDDYDFEDEEDDDK